MTFANHGAQGFFLTLLIPFSVTIAAIIAFISMCPDLSQLRGLWTKDWKWNGFYNWFKNIDGCRWDTWYAWCHNRDQNVWWLWLIPGWDLHILEDKFVHKKTGGWTWYAYVIEGILDVFFVGLIVFIYIMSRSHL